MNSKIKRILTGTMAGAMALSMSATAFAAAPAPDPDLAVSGNTDTVITATYEAIPVKVSVTPVGTALINPYKLPVEFATKDDPEITKEISGEAITTSPLYIINNGKTKLTVGASVIGVANGNFKFAASESVITGDPSAATPIPAATTNSAFVYLQAQSAGVLTISDVTDESVIYDAVLGALSGASWSWETAVTDPTKPGYNSPVVNLKEAKATNMLTLESATINPTNGEITAYPEGSIAAFHLGGTVVEQPKLGWSAEDGFVANVAFSFAPDMTP